MYCSNCNKMIPDDALFCPFCATQQETQKNLGDIHTPPEKKKNTGIVVAVVTGVITFIGIIATIIIVVFSATQIKSENNIIVEEVVVETGTNKKQNNEVISIKNEREEAGEIDKEKPDVVDDYYIQPVGFEQKEANIYVSNITEAGVPEFRGVLSDNEILRFVMNHSLLNYNPPVSGIEFGGYNMNGKYYDVRINNDYVTRLSLRFFGLDKAVSQMNTIAADSEHLYGYSSGVSSQGVAFVENVYCNAEKDEYKINFKVYVSNADDESVYYAYTPAQAEFDNSIHYSYDGYVIVQKCNLYGDTAYKIIEFTKTAD